MAKELKDLFSVRKELGPSSRIVENNSFPGDKCFAFKLINPFLPTRSLRLQTFLVAVLNIIDVVVLMVTQHFLDLRRSSVRTTLCYRVYAIAVVVTFLQNIQARSGVVVAKSVPIKSKKRVRNVM